MSKIMKKSDNTNGFEYILSEMLRFQEAYTNNKCTESRKLFIASEPSGSTFFSIPLGNKKLTIGLNAELKFCEIAKREIKSRKIINTTEQELVDALKKAFSEQVLVKQKTVGDNVTSRDIVEQAVSQVKVENEKTIQYIPLVFFGDFKRDEVIEYGQVRLIGKDVLLKEKKDLVDENNLVGGVSDWASFERYLEGCNVMLEISSPSCSAEISKSRAVICANTIVSIFKIFLGRSARGLRVFDGRLDSNVDFYFYKSNTFNVIKSWDCAGRFHENWRDCLRTNNEDIFKVLSECASYVINPSENELIVNRIVDSLLWFGDAFDDINPCSSIVKYITAIERLVTTSNDMVSKQVSEKGSKLISIFHGDRELWKTDIKKLYSLRSEIVHGSYSISKNHKPPSTALAENIASKVIIGAALVFYNKAFNTNGKNTNLDSIFSELEHHPEKV